MKNFFVKKTYAPFAVLYLFLYVILVLLLIFVVIREEAFSKRYVVFLVIISIPFIPTFLMDAQGIYIKNDEIYYRTWRKHKINTEQIVALKIIRADLKTSYMNIKPIRDKGARYVFSIIALSGIEESMKNYQDGDILFLSQYKEKVIFQTIYDKKFISYLEKRIPNVIVLNDRTQGD